MIGTVSQERIESGVFPVPTDTPSQDCQIGCNSSYSGLAAMVCVCLLRPDQNSYCKRIIVSVQIGFYTSWVWYVAVGIVNKADEGLAVWMRLIALDIFN